jgi:hypothetical protein
LVVRIGYYLFILSINRGFSMNKRLFEIIFEELNTTFRDSLGTIEKKLIESGMTISEAKVASIKMVLQEISKPELQGLVQDPDNLEKFVDKTTDDAEEYNKTLKDLGTLVDKEPMLSKAVNLVMQKLRSSFDKKKQDSKPADTAPKATTGPKAAPKKAEPKPKKADIAPTPKPKAAPKKAEPKPKKADIAPTPPDPDLQYLNQLQNMSPAERAKLGKSLGKNKAERERILAALRKAPPAISKNIARNFGLNPKDLTAPPPAPKPEPKPAASVAPTAVKKPAASAAPTAVKKPAAPVAKGAAGKKVAGKKKKKLTPIQKAKRVVKKYAKFRDGDDDVQISKKFNISKADKEKLPRFGKVGKQVKGGSKQQAADRDTAATPTTTGAWRQGNKGDSVSCLRGRVMGPGDYEKRELTAAVIKGGGMDSDGEKALPFGRSRWTKERKQKFSDGMRKVADSKAIKAVINFMGAAARYGYDPVKFWPNFLWATATDITIKGKPRSPVCLDPRNKSDVKKHLQLQKQAQADGKNKVKDKRKQYSVVKQKSEAIEQYVHSTIAEETNFDSKLPRLPEDYCYEGCSEQQIAEASKRNVKLIPKYKKYVAGLRQKSKGMTLDQFLDLIKYKE